MNMAIFACSSIAVAGFLIAMIGIGRTEEHAIPLAIGLVVSVVGLGWGIPGLHEAQHAWLAGIER
jgi:hypothetical protein